MKNQAKDRAARSKTQDELHARLPAAACGSLEQAKDMLRDTYLHYKDVSGRCVIDLSPELTNGKEGETDNKYTEESEGDAKKERLRLKEIDSDGASRGMATPGPSFAEEEGMGKHRVFYFKPESVMTAHPDIQRSFREKLLNQISATPEIKWPRLLAEELQDSRIASVADRSCPAEMRKVLAAHFKRREYCLRHKRYKLMLRWAHRAPRSKESDHLA